MDEKKYGGRVKKYIYKKRSSKTIDIGSYALKVSEMVSYVCL